MNRKNFLKKLGLGIVAAKVVPEALAPKEPGLTVEGLVEAANTMEKWKRNRPPATAAYYADLLEPGLTKIWREQMLKPPPTFPELFKA